MEPDGEGGGEGVAGSGGIDDVDGEGRDVTASLPRCATPPAGARVTATASPRVQEGLRVPSGPTSVASSPRFGAMTVAADRTGAGSGRAGAGSRTRRSCAWQCSRRRGPRRRRSPVGHDEAAPAGRRPEPGVDRGRVEHEVRPDATAIVFSPASSTRTAATPVAGPAPSSAGGLHPVRPQVLADRRAVGVLADRRDERDPRAQHAAATAASGPCRPCRATGGRRSRCPRRGHRESTMTTSTLAEPTTTTSCTWLA